MTVISGIGSFFMLLEIQFSTSGFGAILAICCFCTVMALGISQWFDIFAARDAFKDGSDPAKTSD
jgi:hypothetical protein